MPQLYRMLFPEYGESGKADKHDAKLKELWSQLSTFESGRGRCKAEAFGRLPRRCLSLADRRVSELFVVLS